MVLVIRDASPEDLMALRDIFRRSSLSNPGDRSVLLANPDALEFSLPAESEGRSRVAIAEDGRILGFATPVNSRGVIELEDLFVDPDWMGRGVGRALVADIVEIARNGGIRSIEVTANPHAMAFYERIGFVADDEVETRFGPARWMHLSVA
jgi:GNAT superfamily N-acetyltransferase